MSRADFLSFSPPYLGEEEIDEVVDALRSGWITSGPKVKHFEEQFSAFIGSPASVAVSSGTAAMQVSLAAMGVGPGDHVITTPMTFASTVHVIEQVGATPVLVDIDPLTLDIDPAGVQRVLDSNHEVAAILPVHMAGQACDMDSIYELATEHECIVVEDAAHSLPARVGDRMIGQIREDLRGHAVCFSFYATKNLTTGEGGMITASPVLADELRVWALHGMSRDAYKRYEQGGSWFYEVVRPGFKANMTDIQAAMGIHQLARLEWMHARRTEIAALYTDAFSEINELQPPVPATGTSHAWHLYVLRLHLEQLTIDRDGFIRELTDRNIGTSVHFIPIHLHPYYRDRYGYSPQDFPVAYSEYLKTISLPLHPGLSDSDVRDVIDAVIDVVERHRR
jgi:dTDP-4-amino-4,6-dideoxygalactose transaminase